MDNENDRIDQLKRNLYSRKTGKITIKRKALKKRDYSGFENAWGEKKTKKDIQNTDLYKIKRKKISIFSIILLISVIFFVIAASFAFFFLFFQNNEVKSEIKLSIIGPNTVKSGEILDFIIKLDNPTKLDYKDIEFVVEYPVSTISSVDKDFISNENIKYPKKLLAGGNIDQKFRPILSGIIGEKKDIKITALYKAGDFSNILYSTKIYKVEIESSPARIEMDYPKQILSKKEFSFDVNIISNSDINIPELIIVGNYPSGFIFSESEPKAVFSNDSQNIFKIKNLSPGEKKQIKIKGTLNGQNNESKFFAFSLGDAIPFKNELRTIFSKLEETISIKRPDIDFHIKSRNSTDDEDNILVFSGENIDFNLKLTNNLPSIMSDIKISANFSKDLIVGTGVKVNKGFYNSNEDKISWNKNSDSRLLILEQDYKVEEKFSFRIKEIKEIAGYFKDPEINIDFIIEGTNFNNEDSEGIFKEMFSKKIKIMTEVVLDTGVYYDDGPFKNTGSTNPVVGKPTTYTVAWRIYNSSSDIEDVFIEATLPPYVKYLNKTSPKSAYITYDPETRKVRVDYKKINAFIGYRTDPKTAYFQIEYIPSLPHKGTYPMLVGNKILRAYDSFSKRDIEKKTNGSNTELKKDSAFEYGIGSVKTN